MYDTVQNPIPKCGLFATKTLAEIQDYIEQMPPEGKAVGHLIMQFTLNACNKIVEDEILSKEIFVQ